MKRTAVALAAALFGATFCLAQTPTCNDAKHATPEELNARIPQLEAFHEVIMPLWHRAWPEKDVAAIKAALPDVKTRVQALNEVTLPGILRDRKEAWTAGLAKMNASLAAYEKAAAGQESQPLLDALEQTHAAFEELVGAVWPKTKELDAYHQVLYQIVHYYAPAKDAAKVREASLQLAERCGALTAAPLPQWAKEKEATLRAGFQALCQETEALKEAAKGDDFVATERALEKAHDQYQAVEKLFE
jgi:hypothetical protein